jgi:hypothetical protein
MLTEKQIETWREVLITLPLPPLNMPLGAYALIMPVEQIERIVERIQEDIDNLIVKTTKEVLEEEKSTNIIRTRPRRKNLVRSSR